MTTYLLCFLSALAGADPVLVDTAALQQLEGAIAVDARDASAFEAGHIPGAAHLDVESLSEDRDGVSGLLRPMPEVMARIATSGIQPDHTLVVYSGLESASDVKTATRLFWILEYAGFPKVRLLDGGLAKWKAEGRPVETGPSSVDAVPASTYAVLKPQEGRYASREQVLDATANKGLVVDLRGSGYFTGEEKSGAAPRAGHIPGAKNRPGDGFLEEPYFTFKSPEAIRRILDTEKQGPVITYCNTGRVATVGYAAYRIAGYEDVAVYDGSMSEWGSHEECPVTTGAEE